MNNFKDFDLIADYSGKIQLMETVLLEIIEKVHIAVFQSLPLNMFVLNETNIFLQELRLLRRRGVWNTQGPGTSDQAPGCLHAERDIAPECKNEARHFRGDRKVLDIGGCRILQKEDRVSLFLIAHHGGARN